MFTMSDQQQKQQGQLVRLLGWIRVAQAVWAQIPQLSPPKSIFLNKPFSPCVHTPRPMNTFQKCFIKILWSLEAIFGTFLGRCSLDPVGGFKGNARRCSQLALPLGGPPRLLVRWGHFCIESWKNNVRGSIVVSISACHAEDPGSIPGRGGH